MPYLWGALQNQLLQSRKKGTTWAICLIIKYVADAAISGIVNDHGAEIRVKMVRPVRFVFISPEKASTTIFGSSQVE